VQATTRRLAKISIIDISGDIDLASSPQLRAILLKELKETKPARLALNLSAVRYIDSSGIASLIEGLKAARDAKIRYVLFSLNTTVKDVMQLSKLTKVFEIVDNEEQATAD
jgi:anti-sigma B factor antagonist